MQERLVEARRRGAAEGLFPRLAPRHGERRATLVLEERVERNKTLERLGKHHGTCDGGEKVAAEEPRHLLLAPAPAALLLALVQPYLALGDVGRKAERPARHARVGVDMPPELAASSVVNRGEQVCRPEACAQAAPGGGNEENRARILLRKSGAPRFEMLLQRRPLAGAGWSRRREARLAQLVIGSVPEECRPQYRHHGERGPSLHLRQEHPEISAKKTPQRHREKQDRKRSYAV